MKWYDSLRDSILIMVEIQ